MSKFGSYGTQVKFKMNCKCFACGKKWKDEMVKTSTFEYPYTNPILVLPDLFRGIAGRGQGLGHE